MKTVLLTFDLEEFDIAQEYGQTVDFETKMRVSRQGMDKILDLLAKYNIQSTIFCTACYAENNPTQIKKIVDLGHELASHSYHHSSFKIEDIELSKQKLEQISGKKIIGFRMPRLQKIDYQHLINSKYEYDSSINPTYMPSRYNHLDKPRTIYSEQTKGFKIVPTSVTPLLRLPLFWLSFKNLPLWWFKIASMRCLKSDGYLSLYFHPWEFCDLNGYGLPAYIRKIDDQKLLDRLERYIQFLLKNNCQFASIEQFLKHH